MTNYDFLFDREYYGEELNEDHRIGRELKWEVVPGAVVLPYLDVQGDIGGGLLDEQGNYIDGSGLGRGEGCGYDVSSKEIKECDEDIVFLGIWPDIWGHCLTDNIRRLWVLDNEDFMDRYGHLRFVYVPMHDREMNKNFEELLRMIGAEKVRLEPVSSLTRFRSAVLPDECFWRSESGTRYFTGEYADIIDRIREYGEEHFVKTNDRKLYFTYRTYNSSRCLGEEKLERFFRNIGYKIVSPEKYTFSEQLNMLLNCSDFASTLGSVSHNCVFLRDGARACLIPRAGFIPEYQPALDQIHDIDITYIDSSLSLYTDPERPWEGPFYFVISPQLQEYFGSYSDGKESRTAFWIYRNLGHAMNGVSAPAEYYREVMADYPFACEKRKNRSERSAGGRFICSFWKIIAVIWNAVH